MGMFEDKEIDNDLKVVDAAIRSYWELAPLKTPEQKTEKAEKAQKKGAK